MPFHFSLKAVLRLREIIEKAELDKLRAVSAQIVQIKNEIETLDADSDRERRMMLDETARGVMGADLHFEVFREEAYRERRKILDKKVQELEVAKVECQKRYVEARQKREILSNLRERQLAQYNLEFSRHEQQQLDEIFLIRRGNTRSL